MKLVHVNDIFTDINYVISYNKGHLVSSNTQDGNFTRFFRVDHFTLSRRPRNPCNSNDMLNVRDLISTS